MENKKYTLLLIAAALLIIFAISFYSLFDTSDYVPVEAIMISSVVYEVVEPSSATEIQSETLTANVININYATREELMLLDGIGEKKAQAIIEYRNIHGYFSTVHELIKVDGINENLISKNIHRITV